MLEMRPGCEHCGKALPNTSEEAMICTFECTFCVDCALKVFENVCPNCGGNFTKRPIRPVAHLTKYPVSTKVVFAPKNLEAVKKKYQHLKNVDPKDR